MSEFVAANVSTPFLLQMVEGNTATNITINEYLTLPFLLGFFRTSSNPPPDIDSQVGLWTGNLVSVFFITQFLTSVLWSQLADRYGRRAVLVSSLIGGAGCLVLFGVSRSLAVAIVVRLAQGVFGGAVGVYRGSIRDITDATNESTAYSLMGFAWGFGRYTLPKSPTAS